MTELEFKTELAKYRFPEDWTIKGTSFLNDKKEEIHKVILIWDAVTKVGDVDRCRIEISPHHDVSDLFECIQRGTTAFIDSYHYKFHYGDEYLGKAPGTDWSIPVVLTKKQPDTSTKEKE